MTGCHNRNVFDTDDACVNTTVYFKRVARSCSHAISELLGDAMVAAG